MEMRVTHPFSRGGFHGGVVLSSHPKFVDHPFFELQKSIVYVWKALEIKINLSMVWRLYKDTMFCYGAKQTGNWRFESSEN